MFFPGDVALLLLSHFLIAYSLCHSHLYSLCWNNHGTVSAVASSSHFLTLSQPSKLYTVNSQHCASYLIIYIFFLHIMVVIFCICLFLSSSVASISLCTRSVNPRYAGLIVGRCLTVAISKIRLPTSNESICVMLPSNN